MADRPRDLRCSFCNRSESEVSQLVAGPHVHICGSCVSIAADIIRHSKQPPSHSAKWLSRWLGVLRRLVVSGGGGRHKRVSEQAC
jgi:hypothetical protein